MVVSHVVALNQNQQVTVVGADGKTRTGKIGQVQGYLGLSRTEVAEAQAGDIIGNYRSGRAENLRHHLL